MKKIVFIIGCTLSSILFSAKSAQAQEQELEQLILNLEKLNQFRETLKQLKEGYEILRNGYNTIKNLSFDNFQLHKAFLDGLLAVSPTVKQYEKVVQIVLLQVELVKQTKSAFHSYSSAQLFSINELAYIEKVFSDLIERSLKNLDGLLLVITANQMRMNTAERMEAIDRLHADMTDKVQFVRHFIQKTSLLQGQRRKSREELNQLQELSK